VSSPGSIDLLFLCTGNASRSVLAGELLRWHRPELRVETAGTLVVEGLPLSVRTRAAFDAIGLEPPFHRSTQATDEHLAASSLVVGLDPEHVRWVRRRHPDMADRATTLVHLTELSGQPQIVNLQALLDRLAMEELAARCPGPYEEIPDPGGGPVEGYMAAAHRIKGLVDRLATRL
jgi:protein-tyrosine-phosphatase